MMWIGVMTELGDIYLFHILNEKKLMIEGEGDVETFLAEELKLSAGSFNWQVLETKGDGEVNFRICEVK